jgi:hypothetical protein
MGKGRNEVRGSSGSEPDELRPNAAIHCRREFTCELSGKAISESLTRPLF